MNMLLSACQAASTIAKHMPQLSVCDAACRHMQSRMLVMYMSDNYIKVNRPCNDQMQYIDMPLTRHNLLHFDDIEQVTTLQDYC